mgnify:CR=1 FL=1
MVLIFILINTSTNITIYNNEHYERYVDGTLLYGYDVIDYRENLTSFIRILRKK